jgi:DNA polymerase V
MVKAGIFPDDILVVDRSLEPVSGKIVVAIYDGELTVKRLKIERGKYWLIPESDDYEPICVHKDTDFQVWGVVCWVIHKV